MENVMTIEEVLPHLVILCEDVELNESQTQKVIDNFKSRVGGESFKNWGEFYAYFDGLVQNLDI